MFLADIKCEQLKMKNIMYKNDEGDTWRDEEIQFTVIHFQLADQNFIVELEVSL